VKCLECDREFQDHTSLGSHIGQSHRYLTTKGYYDKYLKKDPLEGICKVCGKPTKFVYLTTGYNKYCSRKCVVVDMDYDKINSNKQKQTCPFCNREFKSKTALSSHLYHPTSIHKQEIQIIKERLNKEKNKKCEICERKFKDFRSLGIHIGLAHCQGKRELVKEYYDKYLKKDSTEGICKICGKETNFANIIYGYYTYCSTSCSKLDPEIEQKSRQTCLERFGVSNYAKTEFWLNQMINGQAAEMHSKYCIPSKPQVAIYEMVKKLFPTAKIEFWEKTAKKNLDIVIEELKIVIEYHGWYWHHNTIIKDNIRQKKIEDLGWKFLVYWGIEGKDVIPDFETLKNDILRIINK
jgi:G:T-mismatch repair DNA endonuclease (very short patch repair protein)/endogenous inhibitor of DNA gyrase (YacG/DUF329 family)